MSARSHILFVVAKTFFALTLFALLLVGLTWFLVLLAENVASLPADSAFPDEAPAVSMHP